MAKSKSTKRKDKDFLKKPYYEGGLTALRQFIRTNMNYPKEAIKNKIEGRVHVKYSVDHKGKVVKAKVVSGLGHGCDEEALRLVKLLKFKVNRVRKMRVTFNKTIQIHFKIPAKKPTKTGMNISYNVKQKKQDPASDKAAPSKSYSYTINL